MLRTTTRDTLKSAGLNAAQWRARASLHDGMAVRLASALSSLVRDTVDATLVGVEAADYGQFIHGLDDYSCVALVKVQPLGDCVLLDISPSILYPMLDRLLGGSGDEPPPDRPPSDVELSLAARIAKVFLDELSRTWQNVAALQFEIVQIEGRPRQLRALPADEAVAVAGFRLAMSGRTGLAQLCWPGRAIRRFAGKLAIADLDGAQPSTAGGADASNTGAEDAATVELSVALATTSITAGQLRSLRVGDVLVTETDASEPAQVLIDGEPAFSATPGVLGGRKAIRINP